MGFSVSNNRPGRDDGELDAAAADPFSLARLEDVVPVPRARHLLRAKALMDCSILRATQRPGSCQNCRLVACPFQSRISSDIWRDASPLLADTPSGTSSGTTSQHRSKGCRHLRERRTRQCGLVHDRLQPLLRMLPNDLPSNVPSGSRPGSHTGLRSESLRTSLSKQQFSRRQR